MASLGLLSPAVHSLFTTRAWRGPNVGVSSAVHNNLPSAVVGILSNIMKSSGISAAPGQLADALADLLPSLTPGIPITVPTLAEGFAETGGVPVKVSEASAVEPQRNRLIARLVAAFDWIPCVTPGLPDAALAVPIQPEILFSAHIPTTDSCSADSNKCSQQIPHQLINGPRSSGRQPTEHASEVPGMQSVLPGVQDISPHVPGSISHSSTNYWIHKWPALSPGGAETGSEGEGAPTGWELQPTRPKSVIFARLLAVFNWVPFMIPGMPHAALAAECTKTEEVASDDRTMGIDLRDAAAVRSSKQTPVQRTIGPEVPKAAVGPSGRQPTASALASLIPGMHSVLLGVRDIPPGVPGSIWVSSIISQMPRWPALVPGMEDTGSQGEEVPAAGWQQHIVPKGSFLSFCQLVGTGAFLPLRFKNCTVSTSSVTGEETSVGWDLHTIWKGFSSFFHLVRSHSICLQSIIKHLCECKTCLCQRWFLMRAQASHHIAFSPHLATKLLFDLQIQNTAFILTVSNLL